MRLMVHYYQGLRDQLLHLLVLDNTGLHLRYEKWCLGLVLVAEGRQSGRANNQNRSENTVSKGIL